MGTLRDVLEHLHILPALAAAATPSASDEMRQALERFREERANDIASLADRAGRSGARLAIMEREREAWKAYARELERLCMQHGLSLPPAPDE